jgi:plasmid maintenance system antidote protein VapI
MIPDEKSTVRSRELGDALRTAMERANLSGKNVAHALDWSETKVSRLITGHRMVKETEIASLLTLCGIKGKEHERLLALARECNQMSWLQRTSGLPEQLRTLISHEARAAFISEFQPSFVPGLLQTREYTEALLSRSAIMPPERLWEAVQAREGRQNIFNRHNPPVFTFFLHETVFHIPVGGSAVMSAQMHHLIRMNVRSNVGIRVVPAELGPHAGQAGSCRLMEFEEFGSVAYIEAEAIGLFLETPAEVAPYERIFADLQVCALDVPQSQDRIAELAVRLYSE